MKTPRFRRHRFDRPHRERTAFSLLELLVSISIIAILLALSMGAVMKMRSIGQSNSSSDVVSKVQLALDNQYKAIISQARTDMQSRSTQDAAAIMNYFERSGGDQDAALALLTYCRVRQSFPQAFAEVQPFTIQANNVLIYTFPVKSQFQAFQGATNSNPSAYPNQQPYLESSLLLYAAVAQTAASGSTFAAEATNSASKPFTVGSVSATAYFDGFGEPLGFCRFGTNTELQNAPYASGSLMPGAKVIYLDPLDPSGKLYTWATNNKTSGQAAAIASLLFLNNGDPANATYFDATNRRPVVYSVGMNQTYESLGLSPQAVNGNKTNDDILGYRLTQLGAKGTK